MFVNLNSNVTNTVDVYYPPVQPHKTLFAMLLYITALHDIHLLLLKII